MTTYQAITGFWQINIFAVVLTLILLFFHFRTNGNRLTRKSPLFFSGIFLLLLVTCSPLHFLAHDYLFSAHMIQHIIFLLVIPPLLIKGTDENFFDSLVQKKWFRKISFLFYPSISWLVGVGSMWILHIPAVFVAFDSSELMMDLLMLLLLVFGFIFIWPVYAPVPYKKMGVLESAIYLFMACVGCTVLGILITFTPFTLYGSCMTGQNPGLISLIRFNWGMTPDVDQQIGGLIMWVPACIIYLTNILLIIGKWLFASEPEEVHKLHGI
jgi:putative membrane protein